MGVSVERVTALDSGDAKFMALVERFSERLDWMKDDAASRTRQLEMQAGTLNAVEKGISKMEGTISAMRDELRATAKLGERVGDMETRLYRLEDGCARDSSALHTLQEFKDGIVTRLAWVGIASFLGGGGISVLAIKLLFGGQI